jgi:HrpA-like RNA helicase
MVLPTLLKKGYISLKPWMSEGEKDRATNNISINYIMEWFKNRVPSTRGGTPIIPASSINDRIMILRSGTGSGKSTIVAPTLYKEFYKSTRKNICITQLRILTATSIPADIVRLDESLKMGVNIGYQTGSYSYKPRSGILFMTVGILTQQLSMMSDIEFMEKYAFIIIDECHDRSIDMDINMSLLKGLIHRNFNNQDCPFLILMSATFDVERYADYFKVSHKNIVDVTGLNYPVDVNFLPIECNNYVEKIRSTVEVILKKDPILKYSSTDIKYLENIKESQFTDILIFVPTFASTTLIKTELDKYNNSMAIKEDQHYVTIALSGPSYYVGDIDYQNIFKPLQSIKVRLLNGEMVTPVRRIIISTNVAETGVTIDTLKYVIDSGFSNEMFFNPVAGSNSLIQKGVSKASATQRKGRVGRLGNGVFYPIYTNETFDNMIPINYPEIFSKDITPLLLSIITKQIFPDWDGDVSSKPDQVEMFDIDKIDLFDYPQTDSINYSCEKLFTLGLVDANLTPTTIGLLISRMIGIDIELSRMIIAGYQYGANIMDLLTITSFMLMGSRDYINTQSKNKWTETFKYNHQINDDFIDCIFIWDDFTNQIKKMKDKLSIKFIKDWCEENGLHYKGLLEIVSIRDDLIGQFIQTIGLDPFHNGLTLMTDSQIDTGSGNQIDTGSRNQKSISKYNLAELFDIDTTMGMDEVKKIKKCIYEGFRLNVGTLDLDDMKYKMATSHIHVTIKSKKMKPTKFINFVAHSIKMRKDYGPSGLYLYDAERISIMDNYVDIDETFNNS